MKVTELIFIKGFKDRIRMTKAAQSKGFQVENHHEEGYIIVTQEVAEC